MGNTLTDKDMRKAEERALEAYPYSKGKVIATGFGTIEFDQNHDERVGFIAGYEQAIKDMKETFEEMSKNTNNVIDAVKVLGSLLDNPDIRKKLGR